MKNINIALIISVAAMLPGCASQHPRFPQQAKQTLVKCQEESVQSNIEQIHTGFVPVSSVTPLISQRNYEKQQRKVFLNCMKDSGYN